MDEMRQKELVVAFIGTTTMFFIVSSWLQIMYYI